MIVANKIYHHSLILFYEQGTEVGTLDTHRSNYSLHTDCLSGTVPASRSKGVNKLHLALPSQNSQSLVARRRLSRGWKCCFVLVLIGQTLSVAGPHNEGSESRLEDSENTLWKQQPRGRGWGEWQGQEKVLTGQEVALQRTGWGLETELKVLKVRSRSELHPRATGGHRSPWAA